jgi:glycosyltransferase involved in cell wall biosynthesis
MHILLIHQFFLKDNEGGGSRWNEMGRIWTELGHNVTVIAGDVHYMGKGSKQQKAFFEDKFNHNGSRVIRCFVSEKYHAGFLGRIWGYFSFVLSATFAAIFYARDKYDLVLVTSPPLFLGLAGWLVSKCKKIPLLLEIRDLWPDSAIDMKLVKSRILIRLSYFLEYFLYRKADMINVVTPAFKEVLIRKKNIPAGKIILISNAADFSISEYVAKDFDRNAFRCSLGLDDRFVLVYVGAHGPANHLMQVIEAADLLRGSIAHFLLIGDGPEKSHLLDKVKARGLQNISFVSQVSKAEVFRYILAADIGLSVLKRADVFKTVYSNKTFDYFSCKKPVLIAIDGISKELVENANAGSFAEPENAPDLADKIRMYIDSPELIKKQGQNGYQYAKQHFDRTKLAAEYISLIQAFVQKNDAY